MLEDIKNLGESEYSRAKGWDKLDKYRNADGFIELIPTEKCAAQFTSSLTTSIDTLEQKLEMFKEQKKHVERVYNSDIAKKERKKKITKKEIKKQRTSLLDMIFNNADHAEDDSDDEDDDNYIDIKKKKKRTSNNTLDTTYGKRFAPVVAMLNDTIADFDNIAVDIENDLKNIRSKSMYRTSQVGNLISAKNSKLSAVRELASVATTVSNLEYKKEKDKQAVAGTDSNRAIASMAAKYLRGNVDDFDTIDKSNKKKKNKSNNKKQNALSMKSSAFDDEDNEPKANYSSNLQGQDQDHEKLLAGEFAQALLKHKNDIKLTPAERYANIEGTYTFVVVVDPLDPENSWEFMALDNNGREIVGFKDMYKGLMPKKKNCKMIIDLGKLKATDRKTARTYKVIIRN